MEGYHMVVTCTLQDNQNSVRTHALVDCGATGYAFIDEHSASRHNFPLFKLSSSRNLRVIDGRPIASGAITHITKLKLRIREHREEIPLFVTRLGQYPLILGIPWMRRPDVSLRFASNQVVFDSNYCLQHCLKEPVLAQGVDSQVVLSLDAISRPLGHIVLEDHEVRKVVPEVYHDYLPLFSEESAKKLPPDRPGVDHEIKLVPEFEPPFSPLYPLSQNELKAQKE